MTSGTSLVNLGELSKPATVLIEKISDAVGGIFKPWQIRRVAQAEGNAEIIKATSRIEITELQERALMRLAIEEAKKQSNIEAITTKALPAVLTTSEPQNMEDDWITNFFDKCRLISDEEMQSIWAKILAGEANAPGSYSKRTINILGSLTRNDALLFQALCRFSFIIGIITPLIFSSTDEIYNQQGIHFNSLKYLDEIGLISFEPLGGYVRKQLPKKLIIFFHNTPLEIEFPNDGDNKLEIGLALLSETGKELATICDVKPVDGFLPYVIDHWQKIGVVVTTPKVF